MLDPELIGAALDRKSDLGTARKRMKHSKPMRGVRGTPTSDVTRQLVQVWRNNKPKLPRDADSLHELFCAAWEDGLVAIGLASALAPDRPNEALDLAERWLELVDDSETADALGWLLLGPALLSAREPFSTALLSWRQHPQPFARRAAVVAGLAALPEPVLGPAASALRERHGVRHLVFVAEPLGDELQPLLAGYMRDEHPAVRKSVARLLRAWAQHEPERVHTLLQNFPGGVAKQVRDEAERGIRKGRRSKPES